MRLHRFRTGVRLAAGAQVKEFSQRALVSIRISVFVGNYVIVKCQNPGETLSTH